MDRPLTQNINANRDVTSLEQYRRNGGYQGIAKSLSELSAVEVLKQVQEANLRGRGGAGFNTGLKWSFVPQGESAPEEKYLLCNADEMEPGTFKDRLLIECDPHQLLEGMLISAYAIGANKGFIFLRGEYTKAERILLCAIDQAYDAGYLGNNILGSGFSFHLHLHLSAGRYICGEETALINSLEGKRAIPRAKPPFPQVSGLWGKPTIVNNVETLCNVPHIIKNGVQWYQNLSTGKDAGTKLYGVSGQVKNPGCWELPMGVTAREIIEMHGGGMLDGYQLKGFLPGGGSTDFLLPEDMDTPMEYEAIGKAGSRLGTGLIIVLDDRTCPVGMVLNLIRFFSHESCGWCSPCRDGLPWAVQILERMEKGEGSMEDLDVLEDQTRLMAPGNTFCALAPGAMEPLQSALKHFREDFIEHVSSGKCKYKHEKKNKPEVEVYSKEITEED